MHKYTQPQHKSLHALTHRFWPHWKHYRTTHICKHLHLSHIAGLQSHRRPGNTMSLSCWKQISFSPEVSLYHNCRFGGCLGTALSSTVLIAVLGRFPLVGRRLLPAVQLSVSFSTTSKCSASFVHFWLKSQQYNQFFRHRNKMLKKPVSPAVPILLVLVTAD